MIQRSIPRSRLDIDWCNYPRHCEFVLQSHLNQCPKAMRLSSIRVTNLFGVFNHEIHFNLDDRITIIHGPNGYGKTALLMILQCVFNQQFQKLRRVPFESVHLTFADSACLEVRKASRHPSETGRMLVTLQFSFRSPSGGEPKNYVWDNANARRYRSLPSQLIEQHVPDLERVMPDAWLHVPTGRVLDFEEVCEQYGQYLPVLGAPVKGIPEWLTEILGKLNVRLIEAQRLISVGEMRRARHDDSSSGVRLAVSTYSQELAATIQEIQARYGTYSQELDSTFPTRVIQSKPRESTEVAKLEGQLADLDAQRQRIIAAGLLQAQATPIFDPKTQIDESTKGILALYAEDVEKKLSVFHTLTAKVELFKELLNKRYAYKRMEIGIKNGFQITASGGGSLLPSDLSSGEQHELVLFYELLFKTAPNSMILIDEPELSLHVAWQVEFLQDLSKVIQLSAFDVLLATHSPQIINDRWNLAVELKGPAA